jgi:O-antigen/teichoic acid export membrane protein
MSMIGRLAMPGRTAPAATPHYPLAPAEGFATKVAHMLTGTVLGQAISVLLAPVLTRIYLPVQFGYLSVYTAILAIIGVVAALGYELAIPIARSREELANLLAVSVGALIGLTALLGLAAFLAPDRTLRLCWIGSLATFRLLLPLGFACLGAYYVLVAAATRLEAFRYIASTRFSQGVSGPVSQIALGLLGTGTPGLIIGFVIGQSSGTFLLCSRVLLQTPGLLTGISWRGIRRVAWRYRRFPLFASWSKLLESSGASPILFLLFAHFYSNEIAGFLFLTERVIGRPLLMISTSLLQVFTGEAGLAVHREPERVRSRFHQVVPRQFLVSAGWILLANVLAGWAFPVLFGKKWVAAIPYLCAASPGYLALSMLHPVSTALQIMERQALAAAWQAGRLILVIGGVMLAWWLALPAATALWLSSLAQMIACLGMLAQIALSIEQIQRRSQNGS